MLCAVVFFLKWLKIIAGQPSWSGPKREGVDNWLLADTQRHTQVQHPLCSSQCIWGFQEVLKQCWAQQFVVGLNRMDTTNIKQFSLFWQVQ